MKQVRVFQTRDGQTFTDRTIAEQHELMLNLRAIIQKQVNGNSFSSTEIAKIFTDRQDDVFAVIGKHRKTMGSIKAAATRIS